MTADPDRDLALARQLATLALARVGPTGPAGATQAALWWNGLARLGMGPPLFVVHDLGLLLSRPLERRRFRESPGRGALSAVSARYQALLATIAESESLAALGATFMRDEVVTVLLERLLADSWRAHVAGAGRPLDSLSPLTLASPLYTQRPSVLARAHDTTWAEGFLSTLIERELAIITRLDQLDLGPLRLLGLFPPTTTPPGLADLRELLGSTGASDVVELCLQLLPSLLETKRQGTPQVFAVDGYASIERRGAVDALLPEELAHDSEVFALKALSDELLYYGHERPRDGGRRVHGVLVDASASMRGSREVFARALGLALAKKLALLGGEVWVRFFDGRLHRRLEPATLGGQDLPYYLCFRSTRGRNYGRVFQDLLTERQREPTRDVSITFITHGECHIPRPIVEALAGCTSLHGVFVLPSRPLALDYLPLLARHHLVTPESLAEPAARSRRALELVGQLTSPR